MALVAPSGKTEQKIRRASLRAASSKVVQVGVKWPNYRKQSIYGGLSAPLRVELPPARPSSLGWASVQVGDAAGLGLEGPVGVLWPLAKSLENLSHQRTLPGGGWSGQLPALVSLEPGNSPKRQQGGRGSLHPVGPRKLASQGAARCGAGSCDPDASPLVHVGWGHTCGDACLGGSLPPSEPLRPCHPPEAPPNWTWSCSLSGSAPAPCSSCVHGRCSSCRTEPLPTLPSALRPPPPCACPCPLSTGCPSFFVLITPSPDHGLRRGAPHHLRISVALRLRESWCSQCTL